MKPDFRVRFGGVDAAGVTRNVKTASSVDELPSAEIELVIEQLDGLSIDFLSEVKISGVLERAEHDLFTGLVVDVEPVDDILMVRCRGGVALAETLMPPIEANGVSAAEIIHLVTRTAGYREDRLQLDGLDRLPTEAFEVIAPLDGIVVRQPLDVGGVRLMPSSSIDLPQPRPPLAGHFLGASTYAVAYEVAARMVDAETVGLAAIDTVVAWLVVATRYGLARLPSGDYSPFSRSVSTSLPMRRPAVSVHGRQSGRRWTRVVTPVGTSAVPLEIEQNVWQAARAPRNLVLQDRQALLAYQRAVFEPDPLGKVVALWDAIELYVANTQVEELFSDDELEALRAAIPEELRPDKRERVEMKIAELNSPPLLTRLVAALQEDRVPVAQEEMDLLRRLRKSRNYAVHGKGSGGPPTTEDLQHGLGVVSRMIVHRLHHRSRG